MHFQSEREEGASKWHSKIRAERNEIVHKLFRNSLHIQEIDGEKKSCEEIERSFRISFKHHEAVPCIRAVLFLRRFRVNNIL